MTLVSGGLDSTLMALLTNEEGVSQIPVFIDYGQRASGREWAACLRVHSKLKLPEPTRVDLSGYGQTIPSGLTNRKMRLVEDAFLPGRNLLFLVTGAAVAFSRGANAVAIGLLNEKSHLFPDQTTKFLSEAEKTIKLGLGAEIRVMAPLKEFTKAVALRLSKEKGIKGTYSCHAGGVKPCGVCVSCLERLGAERSLTK